MTESRSPRFIQSRVADAGAGSARAPPLLAARPSIAPKYFYDAPRLAPVRGDHRADRVLPDAHRGGDLRRPRRRDARRVRHRRHPGRPRRRQLRQGGEPVPGAASRSAMSRSTSRSSSCARRCARCSASTRSSTWSAWARTSRAGLDLPAELLDGGAPLFFYPGSSIGNFTRDEALRLPAPDPRARRGRRPADRRRPGQAAAGARGRVRRRARRHRRLQSQCAAPPQPAIGSDFEPRQWRHVAFYDEAAVADRDAPRGARRRSSSAGPAASGASPPASASTPRTRTSTRSRASPRCCATRAFATRRPGPTRTAGSRSFARRPEPQRPEPQRVPTSP